MRRVGIYIIALLLLLGCSEDAPILSKEKVDFTSVTLTLVPRGLQSSIRLEYKDLDRDGNPELVSQAVLKPLTIYDVSVRLFDERSGSPINVTDEILLNFSAYTFCYSTGSLDVVINRTDDQGNDILGLNTVWETKDASEGTLLFTIAYQPEKADANCVEGEVQLEVGFNLNVRTGNSPN